LRMGLAAGFTALVASFGSLPFFIFSQSAVMVLNGATAPFVQPWWVFPALILGILYPLVLTPVLLFLFFWSIRSRVLLWKIATVEYVVSFFMLMFFFVNPVGFLLFSPVSNAAALVLGLVLGWKQVKPAMHAAVETKWGMSLLDGS
jgi:hypothetical protein